MLNTMKKSILFIMFFSLSAKIILAQKVEFVFDTLDNWLTIGVSNTMVEEKIGQPDYVSSPERWAFTGNEYQYWQYYDLGLILLFQKNEQGLLVQYIELLKNTFSTSRNIKVADSREKTISKYEKISNMDNTDTTLSVINNIYEGTFSFFKNGKLHRISIGSIAE